MLCIQHKMIEIYKITYSVKLCEVQSTDNAELQHLYCFLVVLSGMDQITVFSCKVKQIINF